MLKALDGTGLARVWQRIKGTVVDNLLSTETDLPLSANQGNELAKLIERAVGTYSRNSAYAGAVHFPNGLLIQWDLYSITPSAANTPTGATVQFPIAYDTPPGVVAVPTTTVIGTTVKGATALNSTNTTVDLYLTRGNTNPTNVQWIAFGYKKYTQ